MKARVAKEATNANSNKDGQGGEDNLVEKDGQGSKDQSRVNTFPQFRNSVVRTKTLYLGSSREGNDWGLPRCKTCEVFLCFVAIVWVRVYYVYYVAFFVLFVLSHW